MEYEAGGMSTGNAAKKVRFGLAMALGVIVPGMLKYVLTQSGYGLLGSVIFYTGYLSAAVVIWYVWIRPLELTGSSGA
ncbi:hypothetical protein ZOD2009_03050 [Haladaptatus paucihalophilus DX253]|uniref:Uncharacterized protein n=2 Tax=Haladaptatus paucihalophilus DX253 TaxID=797209 RepID=E7QNL7_HALPU|nr:hypothetical protein ZOD2009_03050 [Haladaptatus paucihalophilus DX253]